MSRGLNAKAEWVTFLAGTTTGANATQIGIVATKVGLSVDAIRFYERNALMPPLLGRREAFAETANVT
jgi:hypothetical protein